MGYILEISESKKEKLAEHIEKALHEMGKAMACVEQFGSMGEREGNYGMRGGDMGMRGNYGNRGYYGNRDDDDDWEYDEPMMGERRGRSSRTGRYMRR